MGNIVSKIKGYIYTKVNNTKLAIKTRIDNTQNAICTKVNNTKQAIVDKVVHTRDAFCQKVSDVKNGVQNRFNAAADAVFNTVNTVQNGIVNRITGTVTGIRNVKDGIVTKCVQTKEGILKKCTDTKTAVVTKYTDTRNGIVFRYTKTRDGIVHRYKDSKEYIYNKYRQVHEVKLTRYEKFKYSLLFLFFLGVFVLSVLTAWDLYYENYERIRARNRSIWVIISCLCDRLWYFTKQALIYAYFGIIIFVQYAWYTTKLLAYYSWEATKFASWHAWEAVKVGASYVFKGSRIAWQYISYGLAVAGQYLWYGMGVCWEYLILGATIAWEYAVLGSKLSLHYGLEGSKLAAQYTAEGTRYAVVHGSVALKNGSIKAVQWMFYFLTNFRAASKEAGVYLYESGVYLGGCFLSGSYHGSLILWDGTQFMAGKTWEGAVALCHLAVNAYVLVCDLLHSVVEKFIYLTDTGAYAIYSSILYVVITFYDFIIWFFQTANHCIDVSTEFGLMWSKYLLSTASCGVYIGITEYAFVWVCSFGKQVVHWSSIFGAIMWKFITDLFMYVSNCVYTSCVHIYNVLYVIFSFIYQIFSAITTLIKTTSRSLRYCVTSVFSVVIWCLEETIFAYIFMLNKYNMYREVLFAGFIMLLCLYCTGLMRDRKRSLEERDGKESESSSESDEEDEVDDAEQRLVPRKKDLELPSFPALGKKRFPSFDDPASDDDMQQAETVKPADDDLPSTDDDDEFQLDQNVPDFMDLSGSEPEPEPPDLDTTDQDTESHNMSFESQQSQGSSQDVPDLEFPSEIEEDQSEQSAPREESDISSETHEKKVDHEQNGNYVTEEGDNLSNVDTTNNIYEDVLPGEEADLEDERGDEEDHASSVALLDRLNSLKQRKC